MSVTAQLVLLADAPSLFIVASALSNLFWFRRLGRKLDAMSAEMGKASAALRKD